MTVVKDWLKITGPVFKPETEHPKKPVLGLTCTRIEVLYSSASLKIRGFFLNPDILTLFLFCSYYIDHNIRSQPRWLSWMRIRLLIKRLQVRPPPGWQHSFVEIDHEIFSTVIHSFQLIQEGQLSVSGERKCIVLVNCLED